MSERFISKIKSSSRIFDISDIRKPKYGGKSRKSVLRIAGSNTLGFATSAVSTISDFNEKGYICAYHKFNFAGWIYRHKKETLQKFQIQISLPKVEIC